MSFHDHDDDRPSGDDDAVNPWTRPDLNGDLTAIMPTACNMLRYCTLATRYKYYSHRVAPTITPKESVEPGSDDADNKSWKDTVVCALVRSVRVWDLRLLGGLSLCPPTVCSCQWRIERRGGRELHC